MNTIKTIRAILSNALPPFFLTAVIYFLLRDGVADKLRFTCSATMFVAFMYLLIRQAILFSKLGFYWAVVKEEQEGAKLSWQYLALTIVFFIALNALFFFIQT
ncbi:MAG: hypothetical protein KIS94_12345 [Chitinophagales bacterium]|nr:hypothetical protein [Chitinophagales bacterium]